MSLWDRIIIKGFKNCEVAIKNGPISIYSPIDIVDPIDGERRKRFRIETMGTDHENYSIEVDYDEGLLDLMSAIVRCADGMVTIDDETYKIDIHHVV